VKEIIKEMMVVLLFMLLVPYIGMAQRSGGTEKGSTLFRAINCEVLDKNNKQMPVIAFRSMRTKDEVILISKAANHALIVDMKSKKAYKVPKPILGENAVNVSNDRPAQSGNVGFHVKSDKGRAQLTEIIVYFPEGDCFLCEPTVFAEIWD
jgi:hypothetical protein